MVTLFIRCKFKRAILFNFFTGICRDFKVSGFSRHTIYKLIIVVTSFLITFLIKINSKKLDQIISKLLTADISRAVLFCFANVEHL